MITLFRKLRKSLINSGATRKYLTYAIGEIVLVVTGILIALQINNWNEEKKSIAKETQILKSLLEDFTANLAELERSTKRIEELRNSQRLKLSFSGLKESEFTEEMKRTVSGTYFIICDIVDGTLSSILNSEQLELISDEVLKKRLTAYPAYVKKLKKQEDLVADYVVNKQRPLHRKYVSLATSLSDEIPVNDTIKSLAFKSDFEGLLKNKEYFNITVGIIMTNSELLDISKILQVKTEEIRDLISEQLG